MDDFLHNLRKSTERNNERRRNYNNPQYRGPERRGPRDQRRPYHKKTDLQDMLPDVKSILENISAGQKQLVEVTERFADAQERQADVLEGIAILLQRLLEDDGFVHRFAGPLTYAPEKEATMASQGRRALRVSAADREAVIDVILNLRKDGLTYKEIAQHLEDEQIPTFSGKGAWHAQTVHKVCKKAE